MSNSDLELFEVEFLKEFPPVITKTFRIPFFWHFEKKFINVLNALSFVNPCKSTVRSILKLRFSFRPKFDKLLAMKVCFSMGVALSFLNRSRKGLVF